MVSAVFFVFVSLSSLVNIAFSQLACPADNRQTYVDPTSQSTYVIECGYDRPGADVPGSPGWTNTLEECIALCSTTSQCVSVGYIPGSPGPCYMKNALTAPVTKSGMMAAHLPSAEGPKCPAFNGKCLDVPDQGTCYETECDSTRAGNVLLQVTATTFQDCIDQCEANFLNGCTYVNFVPGQGTILPGGTCTLQSTYSQSLTSTPGSWGAIRESICPNRNGGNITIWQGKTYLLECGTDLYGGDMTSPIWTAGIFDCMEACDNMPGCVAASWHWGYPTGPCYLKNVVKPGVRNVDVNAAIWLPDCYSGISTVSTTVYTSTSVYTVTPEAYVEFTPMYQYNLQRSSSSNTPLSYGATPSPSTVPGGPHCYGWVGPGCSGDYKRDALPEPTASPDVPIEARDAPSFCAPSTTVTRTSSSYIYTQTTLQSTCTIYANEATTTVPAYCAPTFAFNIPVAPSLLAATPGNNISIAPSITTVNKLDCCAACTRIFNCVWWNFEFGVNTPNDTWSPGTCTFAYFTGIGNRDGNTPAICPNGVYDGNWYEYANNVDGWSNTVAAWYNTGYNPGACGGAFNLFESNWDPGLPPFYYNNQCPGQHLKG